MRRSVLGSRPWREDLFPGPPEAILRARVVLTVMGGRVVYRGAP